MKKSKIIAVVLTMTMVLSAFFGYAVLTSSAAVVTEFKVTYLPGQLSALFTGSEKYGIQGTGKKKQSGYTLTGTFTDAQAPTCVDGLFTLENNNTDGWKIEFKTESGAVDESKTVYLKEGDPITSAYINKVTSGVNYVQLQQTYTPKETYSMTYDPNGAEGSVVDGKVYSEGGDVKVQSPATLTYVGFQFICWNTKKDGTGTAYAAGDTIKMVKGGITLFAIWEERKIDEEMFNTIYEPNGSEDEPISMEEYIGNDVLIDACWFMFGDCEFIEWNTKADGTGDVYNEGDVVYSISKDNLNEDRDRDGVNDSFVLYAQWKVLVFYDTNGGSAESFEEEGRYGADYTIASGDGLVGMEGEEFLCWNTEFDGSGETYNAGEVVKLQGPVTLYAIYGEAAENYDTGDSTYVFGALAIALLAAGGVVAFKKRK